MADDDDCWDAFGSDSDDDDVGNSNDGSDNDALEGRLPLTTAEENRAASSISMYLSQSFVKDNPQVRLSDRTVLVVRVGQEAPAGDNDKCSISNNLSQRGIKVVQQTVDAQGQRHNSGSTIADAVILLGGANCIENNVEETSDGAAAWKLDLVQSSLCPGGVLIFSSNVPCDTSPTSGDGDPGSLLFRKGSVREKLLTPDATVLHAGGEIRFIARRKRVVHVHSSTCPWLASSHSVSEEEERLELATVPLSSHEMAKSDSTPHSPSRSQGLLTEHSISKAVQSMNRNGYCILKGLLDTNECLEWGSAVLESFHAASEILLERDGVDIYNPQSSESEPQSYRELSMREDLRLDLRQGPALSRLRAKKEGSAVVGGKPVVLKASEDRIGDGLFLRGHPSLMEIVRRTMNPREDGNGGRKNPLYLGNIGRWNFGGSGNDGSYRDLHVSQVGGIISLPGSAEQALHADTPHLFEHLPDTLPAHYINLFAPCTAFDEAVGGTAFVHGSHDLAFCADRHGASGNAAFYPWLVRPQLTVGDVVLFDCRILHFGLANASRTVERCICYVNTWQDWFHDAKNWDQNRAIFEEEETEQGEETTPATQ